MAERIDIHDLVVDNIFDLTYWCREYEKRNKKPATLLNRFAIGFYQIHQGMKWQDNGVNKYESFSAAILHFVMVLERLEIGIENYLAFTNIKLHKLPYRSPLNYEKLLYSLSAAQQQLFYSSPSNKTQRASRYDREKLFENLGYAIAMLLFYIPIDLRQECFYVSGRIMTKELK